MSSIKFVQDPNWNDFRVFLELARTGQLGGAARRLRVDDSTISRRIGQLEITLNTKLFDRSRKGLILTSAGRQLMRHIEEIENHVLAVRQAIQGGVERYVGPVRVAMMEGIGSLFVARHIPGFLRKFPGIGLELVTSPASVSVTRREADVFLSFYEPPGRGLWRVNLGDFHLRLYACEAYLSAKGRPRTLADLAGHVFVDYIDDLIAIDAVRWLHDVVKEPRVIFRSNSMIAQMNAAAAGVGLVLLPCFAGDTDARLRAVGGEQFSTTRTVWMSAHHDLHDVPRVKAVIGFITNLVSEHRALLQGDSGLPAIGPPA